MPSLTPQQNLQEVNRLLSLVRNHPMCARLIPSDAGLTVLYPAGMYPDGARISFAAGKANMLNRLLAVMERHWKENGIH